ncbi:ribonuclease H-like domain-containing protein [Tanacetum coccineum]
MVPRTILTRSGPISPQSLACWVWRPTHKVLDQGNPQQDLKNKGVIDSGCSRHMTGNRSYLTDYEEIDGGFVAFGGNSKGGKITGKGKIKTGKLDFEDVYFVKELKFNLFSVSQMCDKKNSVLFTDTECVVLSPDFKLTDESHVLLKVPRKDNMYSVDLKNVVPQGGIENLIDLRVKVIRCDNRTEFKNRVMNQFCEMKGIKREFSIARTPQQNGVAKRKNRTLIEAARTMLADSKLPTTFWAEAVNTACRKPALSFTRPFGCPVTILNTINHLGKFDGKADEGFFVGYSANSKAFKVFNSRTRIVEENLHVQFSENTPNIARSGPNWLFDIDALKNSMNYKPVVAENQSNGNAGTKACDDAGKARVETLSGKDYILLPLWTQDPPFSSSPKDSPDAGFKPSGEEEKKDAEDPGNKGGNPSEEGESVDQEKDANVNNMNNKNTISPTVNAVGIEDNAINENIVYRCADDPNISDLDEIGRFNDAKDDGAEADMTNLDTHILVSPVPTTRIHKDRPLNQVIGDLQSATQTRQMTKNLEEYRKSFYNSSYNNQAMKDPSLDRTIRNWYVKSAFIYGKIKEEVYVCQPPGFKDPYFLDRVYKVESLSMDCIKLPELEEVMAHSFEKKMSIRSFDEFMGGTHHYILGLQQTHPWKPIASASNMAEGEDVEEHMYRSIDWADDVSYFYQDQINVSMYVVCARFPLLDPKISHRHAVKELLDILKCKKQIVVANSTTEAEYVAASSCCGQKGIGVNVDDSKLMLRGINLLLLEKVNAARHNLLLLVNLQLEDAEGIECLPNADIFEQLALMGKPKRKDTKIPQSSDPTEPIPDEAANKENVPTYSNDPLLSVLDLENTKTTQAQEILSLKLRVKRLEKKGGSRTHKLNRLFKVGRSAQVVSSEDEEQSEKVVEEVVSTAEVSVAATITIEVTTLGLKQ